MFGQVYFQNEFSELAFNAPSVKGRGFFYHFFNYKINTINARKLQSFDFFVSLKYNFNFNFSIILGLNKILKSGLNKLEGYLHCFLKIICLKPLFLDPSFQRYFLMSKMKQKVVKWIWKYGKIWRLDEWRILCMTKFLLFHESKYSHLY